jgi:hypothetical protein
MLFIKIRECGLFRTIFSLLGDGKANILIFSVFARIYGTDIATAIA